MLQQPAQAIDHIRRLRRSYCSRVSAFAATAVAAEEGDIVPALSG